MARVLPFKFFWIFHKFLFFAKVKWQFRNHLVSLQENAFSKKCSAWCNGRWIKKEGIFTLSMTCGKIHKLQRTMLVEDIVITYFLLFSFTRFFFVIFGIQSISVAISTEVTQWTFQATLLYGIRTLEVVISECMLRSRHFDNLRDQLL